MRAHLTIVLAYTCGAFAPLLPARRVPAPFVARRTRTVVVAAGGEEESAEALLAQATALREEARALEEALLSEQEAKLQVALDAAFASADANGDGVVTVEELRSALRAAFVDGNEGTSGARNFERLLSTGETDYVESLVQSLDENGDGVLQPEEFAPLKELRARLEARWREDQAVASSARSEEALEAEVEATRAERLGAWEAISNSTDAPTRALGVGAYFLPALDILPPPQPVDALLSSVPVDSLLGSDAPAPLGTAVLNPVLGVLDQINLAFHAVPFSGLVAFIVLSNLASNAGAPRLARFAARHAIVIDLASAVGLPLLLVAEATAPYARPLFAAVIFASVLATALGAEPSFVPVTGQLTKKFTDDFEAVVKQVISATVGTTPVNLLELQTPKKDDDKEGGDTTKEEEDKKED